jgi:hypothetical protein
MTQPMLGWCGHSAIFMWALCGCAALDAFNQQYCVLASPPSSPQLARGAAALSLHIIHCTASMRDNPSTLSSQRLRMSVGIDFTGIILCQRHCQFWMRLNASLFPRASASPDEGKQKCWLDCTSGVLASRCAHVCRLRSADRQTSL